MSEPKEHIPQRRPPIRLPFEKRQTDIGVWSYDHRLGISVTLALYIVFAILFATGKISLSDKDAEGQIIVNFPPEPKREQIQQKIMEEMRREDFANVRNASSNDNAEKLDSRIRDDRGTQADKLYEDAGKLDEAMRANKALYEAGIAQEQATLGRSGGDKSKDNGQSRDSKIDGRVTVRFSFSDPVRSSVKLVTPAYQCEGGGSVELSVTLDNNGNVTSASVNKSASSSDECMQDTAINAARQSRFNVDGSAPSRHKGTITYTFIPQ